MSIIKRLRLDGVKQGINLEFRAEVFNLFDRVNFAAPVNDMSSGAFGRIGSTSPPAREWQFGIKVNF